MYYIIPYNILYIQSGQIIESDISDNYNSKCAKLAQMQMYTVTGRYC